MITESTTRINVHRLIPNRESIHTNHINDDSVIVKKDDLIIIRNRFIEIKNLISSYNTLTIRETDRRRISREDSQYELVELELERRPKRKRETSRFSGGGPSLPNFGFIENIKKFVDTILLGIVGIKMIPMIKYLPTIVNKVGGAIDFATDLFIGLFDGLATFVKKGYDAYDFTRNQLKSFGGDNLVKLFDGFTNAIENIFTGAVIAAYAFSDIEGEDKDSEERERPRTRPPISDTSTRPRVVSQTVRTSALQRYFQRHGRGAFVQRFGEESLQRLPRSLQRTSVERLGRRAFVGALGKGNAKVILRTARPFLKRIPLPVVGALIDFGLSWALGENPGRAAFRAIGAGILGTVGAGLLGAVGTAGGPLAIAGAILGGLAGGAAGDWAGGALYDLFFGNKPKAGQQKVNAAGGGQVPITRGGKIVPSRPTRRQPTQQYRREIQTKIPPVKPGSSIGGQKKLEKVFPEPDSNSRDKDKQVNPLGYLKKSYNKATGAFGFGGIFALALKAQLGEKPSDLDYRNAASGIVSWMQTTFSNQVLRTGGAFAEGGKVDANMLGENLFGGNLSDMKRVIAKSIQKSVSPKLNESIRELMKQLGLKEPEEKKVEPQPEQNGGMAGQYSPEGLQGDIYNYLLSKGLSDNHILGIMANISRESGFRPGISEPGGPGIGLFQYSSEPRKSNFLRAVPDYATNWKGQIDFALSEDVAPQYLQMRFSSAQEAADWWMREWERPAEYIQTTEGPRIHREYIASLERYRTRQGYSIPTSADASLGTALGSLSLANQIAASMGLQLTSHVRPESSGYHRTGRAMDFQTVGAPGNMGTPSQLTFANEMIRRYGSSLKELIYTPLGFGIKDGRRVPLSFWSERTNRTHYDHVHVAFAKGGRVLKPTFATLAEKGPEFVFDADTTKGLDILAPGLLEKLNIAKTKSQIASILRSYADYEEGAEKIVYVIAPKTQIVPVPYAVPGPSQGGFAGGGASSRHDVLYSGY